MSAGNRDQGEWNSAIAFGVNKSLEIFEKLNAVPCKGMVKQNLGVIFNLKGCDKDAEAHLISAITIFENLWAAPDLCESYLAMARLKLRVNLSAEAKFYLSEAETVIDRIDYKTVRIKMLLYNVWGDFYHAEQILQRIIEQLSKGSSLIQNAGKPAKRRQKPFAIWDSWPPPKSTMKKHRPDLRMLYRHLQSTWCRIRCPFDLQ